MLLQFSQVGHRQEQATGLLCPVLRIISIFFTAHLTLAVYTYGYSSISISITNTPVTGPTDLSGFWLKYHFFWMQASSQQARSCRGSFTYTFIILYHSQNLRVASGVHPNAMLSHRKGLYIAAYNVTLWHHRPVLAVSSTVNRFRNMAILNFDHVTMTP